MTDSNISLIHSVFEQLYDLELEYEKKEIIFSNIESELNKINHEIQNFEIFDQIKKIGEEESKEINYDAQLDQTISYLENYIKIINSEI